MNIILTSSPVDVVTINGYGLNGISIVNLVDTISMGVASHLSAESLSDKIVMSGSSNSTGVSMQSPVDKIVMSGLPGSIGNIHIVNVMDTAPGVAFPNRKGALSIVSPVDVVRLRGLHGSIGSISTDGLVDVISITVPVDTHCTLSMVNPVDFIYSSSHTVPITAIRESILMNSKNLAVTKYVNQNFNSIAQVGEILIGFNEQGAFVLGGSRDGDQFIDVDLKTGMMDLGQKEIQIPMEAWIAGEVNADELQASVRLDNKVEWEYPFTSFHGSNQARAKLGKGFKGRFYQFGLSDTGESPLSVKSLRILGKVILRKTR